MKKSPQVNRSRVLCFLFFAVHLQSIFDVAKRGQQSSHYTVIVWLARLLVFYTLWCQHRQRCVVVCRRRKTGRLIMLNLWILVNDLIRFNVLSLSTAHHRHDMHPSRSALGDIIGVRRANFSPRLVSLRLTSFSALSHKIVIGCQLEATTINYLELPVLNF